MTSRRAMTRALATAATRSSPRPNIAGMRVDTSSYTATGGSGQDSTALSESMADATSKARSAYRIALRGIPDMRRNFTIIEDEALVRACIRDLFEKHRDVTEPHIVDMLVFKALQELREIGEQWKSRHHVTAYITRYSEKLIREETARRLEEDVPDASDKREETLRMWRERGIVPPEILTWGMFQRWKEEEDTKFKTFALENKLFSEEELDRNSKSSTCTIM